LGDRQTRWSLVGASAILSVGFVTTAPGFLDLGAFYASSVHFALWATLVLAWSCIHHLYRGEIKDGFKSDYAKPFYIALGLTCFLFYSVGTGNRIPAEASYWTGVSQTLHQNYNLGNARGPAFYPFLASILHSLFGFKDQHMQWINFMACAFLFTLMIRAGERIMRNRWYGVAAVFFLASFPMFGIMVTSNSPDVLNTLLVAAVCYQIVRFVQEPGLVRAELAIALTLLAAQCSPASLFFLIPIGALAYQNRKNILGERPDLKTVLLPIVAIPVASLILANGWLSNQMNVNFLTGNIRGAADFILNRGSGFPLSSQIFTLCAVAGIALVASQWQRIAKGNHQLVKAVTYIVGGLGLVTVATLAYESLDMGRFADFRYLLVYLPILALCATYPLYRLYEKGVGASVVGLLVVANFCYQLPNQTRTATLNLEQKVAPTAQTAGATTRRPATSENGTLSAPCPSGPPR
jgi:4-amino-4-deoxy-L-arabinose transferase-like glycosyltransferase